MSDAPERIWIDRGPGGGWMHRHEKLWDSRHEFVRTDLIQPMIDKAVAEALERAAVMLIEAAMHGGEDAQCLLDSAEAIRALIPR